MWLWAPLSSTFGSPFLVHSVSAADGRRRDPRPSVAAVGDLFLPQGGGDPFSPPPLLAAAPTSSVPVTPVRGGGGGSSSAPIRFPAAAAGAVPERGDELAGLLERMPLWNSGRPYLTGHALIMVCVCGGGGWDAREGRMEGCWGGERSSNHGMWWEEGGRRGEPSSVGLKSVRSYFVPAGNVPGSFAYKHIL